LHAVGSVPPGPTPDHGALDGFARHDGATPRLPEQAVARLHALTEISKAATGGAPFDEVLGLAAEAARAALDAASLSVSVWERDQARVRVLVNVGVLGPGEEPEPLDETYLVTDQPVLGPLFSEGTPYVRRVDAQPHDPDFDPAHARLLRVLEKGGAVGVPVVLEGRIWGELYATRREGEPPYVPADVDYATAVSAQLAAALAQAQHLEQVQRLAYTDPLTGLANRRAIDDRLDALVDRHRACGTVASLVVVDVNGLKRINDDRGHEAGDRALVHFAGLLSASAGLVPGSLAGRTGGDEFCVIIEGGTADDAVWVAEDLCRRATAALEEGVACGVASTDDPVGPVDSPGRLFRLADAAQSRAKRSGARHPVVAGRGLPADAIVRLVDAVDDRPRRRTPRADRRRVRARRDVAHVLDDVLETLDHAVASGPAARLEVVADAVCRLVDGCSWWVSATDEAGDTLLTVNFSAIRYAGGLVADPEAAAGGLTAFALADYPTSARMLDGDGTMLAADDPGADPAERAILDGAGFSALVMAGGRDATGRGWLVEVYCDDISADVTALPSVLRALTACALVEPAGR
jgi:diguanylate cyclase (GGDEF)-like protein